jgi:hypothetical protein
VLLTEAGGGHFGRDVDADAGYDLGDHLVARDTADQFLLRFSVVDDDAGQMEKGAE